MELVWKEVDFTEMLFSVFNSRQTFFKVQNLSLEVLRFLALFTWFQSL